MNKLLYLLYIVAVVVVFVHCFACSHYTWNNIRVNIIRSKSLIEIFE